MRREDGAVAVVVALMAVVLFAAAAVVVDFGNLFVERRELQNGADAAALAVATVCATDGCTATEAQVLAATYTSANDDDDANVLLVCGSGSGLPVCTAEEDLAYSGNYALVRTQSGDAAQSAGIRSIVAGLLGGAPASTVVKGRAVARWGKLGSGTGDLPITVRACRWNALTNNGTTFATVPTGDPDTWVEGIYPLSDATRLLERDHTIIVKTQDNELIEADEVECPPLDDPAAPGNFSWLDTTDGTCEAELIEGSLTDFDNDTGADVPSVCRDVLEHLVGTVVTMPIYVEPPDGGDVGAYTTDGLASFYVTGYTLTGERSNPTSLLGTDWCNQSTLCISGLFVETAIDGQIVDDSSLGYGATAVQMAY